MGQCSCFKKRWHQHKQSLLVNKHQNRFLQSDFNKCKEELGHDDFLEFHVLEVMENSTKESRKEKEQHWLDRYFDHQTQCYNIQRKATLSQVEIPRIKARDQKHSQEWNWRISEAHKGKKLSEEHKRKIGITSKGRGLGIKRSPSVGEKISLKKRGKPNPMSEATRLKMCKTYNVSLTSPDGLVYKDIIDVVVFAQEHDLSVSGLRFLIYGKRNSHKGWKRIK